MTATQHLASIATGAIATTGVLSEISIPQNKETVVGLISAVIVQTAIFGLTELRKLLKRKTSKS